MVEVMILGEDKKIQFSKECETALVFLVKDSNVSIGVSGEIFEQRIEDFKKQVPKMFKNFIKDLKDTYQKEVKKEQAIRKVKEIMQSEEE